MALFGDEDGDVGPFVMAEGGEEEWFPFTLDNLEMDRACSSLAEDSRPMDQVCACCPLSFSVPKSCFCKKKNHGTRAGATHRTMYARPALAAPIEAKGHTPASVQPEHLEVPRYNLCEALERSSVGCTLRARVASSSACWSERD